jgi:hypothetical protein
MNTMEELEHIDHILTMDAYRAWLYENYAIGNGHTLTRLEEDASVQVNYLSDMGLPLDSEIKD